MEHIRLSRKCHVFGEAAPGEKHLPFGESLGYTFPTGRRRLGIARRIAPILLYQLYFLFYVPAPLPLQPLFPGVRSRFLCRLGGANATVSSGEHPMVLPIGSLINALVVIFGGMLGMLLGNRLPERVREIVFQGLGMCTLVIGMSMALKTGNPLYMVGSVLLGALIGEGLRLEDGIARGSDRLKKALRSGNGRFTDGFVSATVLFCIGAMAILGPPQEGLDGDMTTVLTKSMLDFFASIAFGAAYGSGVMWSALPLLLYQGSITVFAKSIRPLLSDMMLVELTAVGGVIILGIGINLLELKKIRLSNFLPALVVSVLLCSLVPRIQSLL